MQLTAGPAVWVGADQTSAGSEGVVAVGSDGASSGAEVVVGRGAVVRESPVEVRHEVLAELVLKCDGEQISAVVHMRARD